MKITSRYRVPAFYQASEHLAKPRMKALFRKTHSAALVLACSLMAAYGSSHREAPLITSTPKLDGTDFYMFNSYESGRSNFVTLIANYLPLQDPYGGPNYYPLETNAVYEIHIDNNGDAKEDVTFQFRFSQEVKNIALPIGPEGNQRMNPVPVIAVGPIAAGDTGNLNRIETYNLQIIRGDRRTGTAEAVTREIPPEGVGPRHEGGGSGNAKFIKPVDNIGTKTIPDYAAYANAHIYTINIPGCPTPGRVFVGQRKDPFVVNLGEIFDLLNLNPLGPVAGERDDLADKNVTSLVLEVPKECLLSGTNTVIAGWTTASTISSNGFTQRSRLGQPLVNEVVIGLPDKDLFNSVPPTADEALAHYVTHPTLPAIVELLFGSAGVEAPNQFPRSDLVTVFLTGIPGLNQTSATAEMLRLNTSIPAVPAEQQNNLGVIEGDQAGFPNGRRPGDDVVDIALRVVMGKLLSAEEAPSGQLPYTDGALVNASMFPSEFPYLRQPLPGSPNDFSINITLQAADSVDGTFTDAPSTFNAEEQTLITPRSEGDQRFYRLKTDGTGGVRLDRDRIEVDSNVQLGVSR